MPPRPKPSQTSERQAKLVARFEAQARFCTTSSPLYHQLFTILGRRLSEDDDFADWLLTASGKRASFDVPLLLLAALHRKVLDHKPETRELAAWYPSVGGTQDAGAQALTQALKNSIDALRAELATFIAGRPVQTNEAGRGLCWLLPASYTGWPQVHLVELGASAGLNLVAEEHCFVLCDVHEPDGARYYFGQSRGAEFEVQGEGAFARPHSAAVPQVVSRLGCDLAPVQISSKAERLYLAAFIWADQPGRMHVLNQAVDTLLHVNTTATPIRLQACRLPDELPGFLHGLPKLAAPCILYNSYLNAYLPDKGKTLSTYIARWALPQQPPVLWVQWEHLRSKEEPPALGWLGWTAQLWYQGRHQSWHLAWVHPHGSRVVWLPGIFAWQAYWQQWG